MCLLLTQSLTVRGETYNFVPFCMFYVTVHKQFNRIYSVEGVMCTLMAQESSGRYWIYDGQGVRKLTKDECKSLMGFPEEYIIEGNQKDFYRFVGNSICVPMVEEIARVVKDLF